MKCIYAIATAAAFVVPTAAIAAPGLGDEVYGAAVERGELEIEGRYGALNGGPDDGEDVLKLEAGYGVTDKLRLAVVGEFEKEADENRRAEAVSLEAIYALGKVGPFQVAVYGEYEIGLHGGDKIETKLLLQQKSGLFDLRFNLIAEKELEGGEPVELAYAASADVETFGEIRLGVQAYGELGTFRHFAPRTEHFLGPVAKFEIEGLGPELGIEAGYLFPLGSAKDDTNGQFKLRIEFEF